MLRFSPLAALTVAVAAVLLFAGTARGQDPPPFVGSVEIAEAKAIKVRKLSSLLLAEFAGSRGEFQAPAGKTFLVLHLELKPTFGTTPEGEELCYALPEAVTLKAGEGETAWSIGTCDPHGGRFRNYVSGYSFYKSGDEFTAGYDPVFVVPEGATEATLTLGGTTHPIAIPQEVVDAVDPSQAIQLKAETPRIVTELQRKQELGMYEHEEGEFVQQIVTTAGRYLLVPIVLKPKVRNESMGYGGSVYHFGLLLGKEVYVAPIGVYEDGELRDYASDFYFDRDALGEFNAGKATLVFPLPGAVSSGKLLYLGSPVADLTFGG